MTYEEAKQRLMKIDVSLGGNAPIMLCLPEAFDMPNKWEKHWHEIVIDWKKRAEGIPSGEYINVSSYDIYCLMDRLTLLVNDAIYKHLEILRLNEELHGANMQCAQLLAERDERRRNTK